MTTCTGNITIKRLEQYCRKLLRSFTKQVLINQDGMFRLYYSLFLPYIIYSSDIWGNTYVTSIRCITILQQLVVRLVCAAKRLEHTSTLFNELRILKCEDIVRFNTAIIIYKAYHNVLPNSLQNMFKLYLSTRGTRHKYTIRSHRMPINIKSVCISDCGVKQWQSLHENITSCCIFFSMH